MNLRVQQRPQGDVTMTKAQLRKLIAYMYAIGLHESIKDKTVARRFDENKICQQLLKQLELI